jgi:hypothetical protein
MSFLLNLYPAYQSAVCMGTPEHPNMNHWLTFWIMTYFIEQMPLPSLISYPATALLYFPDSTQFIRENVLFKGVDLTNQYAPEVKEKFLNYVKKYIPEQQAGDAVSWWQFWKTQQHPHQE